MKRNMQEGPTSRFFGLTQNELFILLASAGILVCIIILFAAYVVYTSTRLSSVPPTLASSAPPTQRPLAQPTSQPPQFSPTVSIPFAPPPAVPTPIGPEAIPTPVPGQLGGFDNPVPLGSGFTFPGLGTLTVMKSSWSPGQTGFAIVELSFRCELPPSQQCETLHFMLDALGGSGNGYDQKFDSAIPSPTFGYDNPPVYGGGTEHGYAGFFVDKSETVLEDASTAIPRKW